MTPEHADVVPGTAMAGVKPGVTYTNEQLFYGMMLPSGNDAAIAVAEGIAGSEQAFANETLPVGACFVPRIRQVGPKTLRCWFASEQPGKRQSQTYYRDLDLRTMTFEEEIHRMKLKTSEGLFDLQPKPLHADAAKQAQAQLDKMNAEGR